ncbi:MAG: hypothetical protein QM784_33250 [Polyangiaceae bacterium]
MRREMGLGIALGSLLFGLSLPALASPADTDSVACGSSPAGWNAPNGALVLARSRGGMVTPTLSAIGEHYTHTMLSHGAGGWTTHSTMYTPGTTGWPTYCSTPLKSGELKSGYPGASQTNQGGIYTFLYLDGDGIEQIHFQRSMRQGVYDDSGLAIANYLWSSLPYQTTYSKSNGGETIYRLKHHQNLAFMPYVLYQYRNSERFNEGIAAWNNGSVCSTLFAYAQFLAGKGIVTTATYSHTKTVAAGNALYDSIEDRCNTDTDFVTDAGAAITCFEGISATTLPDRHAIACPLACAILTTTNIGTP